MLGELSDMSGCAWVHTDSQIVRSGAATRPILMRYSPWSLLLCHPQRALFIQTWGRCSSPLWANYAICLATATLMLTAYHSYVRCPPTPHTVKSTSHKKARKLVSQFAVSASYAGSIQRPVQGRESSDISTFVFTLMVWVFNTGNKQGRKPVTLC